MNARITAALFIAFAALTSAGHAGAFDPRHVPADVPWIVHIDLEALADSTILRSLHADGVRFENEFDLDGVEKDFGLSPFVDLRSLTFYGAGALNHEYVCVAVGGPAIGAAKDRLVQKGAQPKRVNGVDAWAIAGREPRIAALLPATGGGGRVAVVAQTETALAAALLVLKDKAASLATPPQGKRPAILSKPKRGSLVFAASAPVARLQENETYLHRALELLCDMAVVDEGDEVLFALGTRAIDFDMAETSGELQLVLGIDATTPAKAKEMEGVFRAAVTRAAQPSDTAEVAARAAKLLSKLQFETLAGRFRASYRYPSATWVEDIHFVEAKRGIRKN